MHCLDAIRPIKYLNKANPSLLHYTVYDFEIRAVIFCNFSKFQSDSTYDMYKSRDMTSDIIFPYIIPHMQNVCNF